MFSLHEVKKGSLKKGFLLDSPFLSCLNLMSTWSAFCFVYCRAVTGLLPFYKLLSWIIVFLLFFLFLVVPCYLVAVMVMMKTCPLGFRFNTLQHAKPFSFYSLSLSLSPDLPPTTNNHLLLRRPISTNCNQRKKMMIIIIIIIIIIIAIVDYTVWKKNNYF